ncbi:ABC transporter permease [Scleromatobacter humisilvae]|uniref:ABC transporter permease n=1 Tax=Scleromatobacter humisilvae TaxID=2897159 RepID=A0A9X1YL93_9BURK|nr:ABC transporter permease [Scleromatobacter humisilvae]MCK9686965.1 ABC transporter permease [Scleromatobacter humisilvae]
MGAYVVRRLLQAIPTVLGVALLTFLLFNAFGPDPVRTALGNHATPEAVAALRRQWGLDQPLALQFVDFLRQIVTFDYGKSFVTGEDLGTQLKAGALVSLSVTLPPFIFAAIVDVAIALFIARHRDGVVDRAARVLFVAAMSVSALVYVLALQYLLAFRLGWFPINGYEGGWAAARYLGLPWLIQLLLLMGPDIRLYRTLFLADIDADWVRTARAKGASERRVLLRHVLPNAWIPIITHNVTTIPFLILGSFLMERFFSIPGIGNLTIDALSRGDLPILKAVTVLGALALVVFNLLNDLLVALADPRVRLS